MYNNNVYNKYHNNYLFLKIKTPHTPPYQLKYHPRKTSKINKKRMIFKAAELINGNMVFHYFGILYQIKEKLNIQIGVQGTVPASKQQAKKSFIGKCY